MKIAIIGAGTAGIYTSLMLRDFFGEIVLFEKENEIGKKLKITGGGKMNIGNKKFSKEKFVSNEPNLLKNIYKNPFSKDVLKLFKKTGTQYKFQGNRVILKSENAVAEVKRLESLLKKQENLKLKKNTKVEKIKAERSNFLIKDEKFDFVVIASGSRVKIGKPNSEEKSYKIPSSLGHSTTKIKPALCPIILQKNIFAGLEGISLVCQILNPKAKINSTGKIIFTHQGLSGPAVLDFTVHDLEKEILINFLPNLTEESFKKELKAKRQGRGFIKKFLAKSLPKKLVTWVLEQSKIKKDKIIANLSKDEEKELMHNLYRFTIKNPKKAPIQAGWTVRGGISLKEIQPATMESKLHNNLFFAGEILDVTGLCGGFNISFAMLSAKIVSDAILRKQLT